MISPEEAALTCAAELLRDVCGLDVESEHGSETPKRFVKMLKDMTTRVPFEFTTFENVRAVDDMVVVGPITFSSLCNHHVVPFIGEAWVGYIPEATICGLSKLARAVKYHAKGLHVQEHLNDEIADYLEDKLQPKGVAVVMRAEHMCMSMRGVEELASKTVTSSMRGVFSDHERTAKAEFMGIIRGLGY